MVFFDLLDLLEVFSFLPLVLDELFFFEDLEEDFEEDLEEDFEEDLEELAFLEDFAPEELFASALLDFACFDLLSLLELLPLFPFDDLSPDFVDLVELEPEALVLVLCCSFAEFFACTIAGPTIMAVDKTSIENKRYMVRMQVLLFF